MILNPIHNAEADADATQLSSWVASAVCIEFATSWWQSRVSTSLNKFADNEVGRINPIHTADTDATQLSSWAASALAVCIEFKIIRAGRLPTKIWKLNMLRIYPAELSCVGGVYWLWQTDGRTDNSTVPTGNWSTELHFTWRPRALKLYTAQGLSSFLRSKFRVCYNANETAS